MCVYKQHSWFMVGLMVAWKKTIIFLFSKALFLFTDSSCLVVGQQSHLPCNPDGQPRPPIRPKFLMKTWLPYLGKKVNSLIAVICQAIWILEQKVKLQMILKRIQKMEINRPKMNKYFQPFLSFFGLFLSLFGTF